MVQLKILSGKQAGVQVTARHFPFVLGRGAQADLTLEEAGVWDRHLELDLNPAGDFVATAPSAGGVTLNGLPVQRAVLRHGDCLTLGSVTLQFWLSATRQASQRLRERLTWTFLALLCLGQVALVYWL